MRLVFITHDFQSVYGEWAEDLYSFPFTNIDLAECIQHCDVWDNRQRELRDHQSRTFILQMKNKQINKNKPANEILRARQRNLHSENSKV